LRINTGGGVKGKDKQQQGVRRRIKAGQAGKRTRKGTCKYLRLRLVRVKSGGALKPGRAVNQLGRLRVHHPVKRAAKAEPAGSAI
jgi:hypothetical protein